MVPVLLAAERRSPRRAVETRCQVVAERGFRLLGRVTRDLSSGGLLLPTVRPVHLGEPVLVSLLAPGTREWIDAEGRIARVVAGRRGGDDGRSIGVVFERMDALGRALLRATLRGLPPPLPRRPARRDYAATVALVGREG